MGNGPHHANRPGAQTGHLGDTGNATERV